METAGTETAPGVPSGLTSESARSLRTEYGPNAVVEEREHPLRSLLGKLWAPVPWMLEVAVVLEALLHRYAEGGVIAALLVFNAGLSYVQERNAQKALALLRRRLTIEVRVRRDGVWQRLPAEQLVPGDLIHLRTGDVAAADVRISGGQVLVDHSAVTGESMPADLGVGGVLYTGGLIKRGEADGVVTATGGHTYFGKAAELVGQAKAAGHLQQTIFTIVKYLVAIDVVLAVLVLLYALSAGIGLGDILPFCLMLLIASVPVALPATFTLAAALGTRELASRGVLVSRLTAIEEAAAMDVLASDKTGTLTKNELSLAVTRPVSPYGEADVIRYAALASSDATQDPIDLAILAAARGRDAGSEDFAVQKFVPFDPSTKYSEAVVVHGAKTLRVLKGAPSAISAMTGAAASGEGDKLAAEGYRVLAVAAGEGSDLSVVGFVALLDPPRDDSAKLVADLQHLGVRVLMITGDGPATAATVAARVGIHGAVCDRKQFETGIAAAAAECGVFGGVFPEDKFRLVQALQSQGHVVGMTGDGVNDAPALKQAEVGIAVANATDVAKAAASIVLTNPGLSDVVSAVETSRRIYQRMLTYTLNKIIKTIEVSAFLTLGVLLTRTLVINPLLIVLLLFTNDFVTMSIATDRVSFSPAPDRWRIRELVTAAAPLAALLVLFSLAVLFIGRDVFLLSTPQIRTLVFLTLVFGGQGTVYLVRERGHLWSSRPSPWMLWSSAADLLAVGFLASQGILMARLPLAVIGGLAGAVLCYLLLVDFLKIFILRVVDLASS
ncbi:MAG TPA: plasma-membrane proton-efflux P-type ATPase [Bryobacteraceae bacterium]|nr:plasma-membrane proton-efflux P-type ATPase [Bryobacteraceae bacterium]